MDYREFIKEVEAGVKRLAGEGTDVFIEEIKKNNNVSRWGILAREEGEGLEPVIYLEPFYQSFLGGADMEEVIEAVYRACLDNRPRQFNATILNDYEAAKEFILFKLINYGMNKELLEEIPYQKHLDLAAVFYLSIPIGEEGVHAAVTVRNEHLKKWGVTAEEVAQTAYANTPELQPCQIQSLEEFMGALPEAPACPVTEEEMEETGLEMILIGSRSKFFGAACLLYPNLLKGLAEEKKTNFVILPSSVHELILVPVLEGREQTDFSMYTKMVREVNATQLQRDEVLSDHAYFYDRKDEKLYEA